MIVRHDSSIEEVRIKVYKPATNEVDTLRDMSWVDSAYNLPIKIRPFTSNDVNFILSSWLQSMRYTQDRNKKLSKNNYFAKYHDLCKTILMRAGAKVACNDTDPSQIYGYIIGEYVDTRPVVHWVYVKLQFRRWGIGEALYKDFVSKSDQKPLWTNDNTHRHYIIARYHHDYNPDLFYSGITYSLPIHAIRGFDEKNTAEKGSI